jgi:hypothetical protein
MALLSTAQLAYNATASLIIDILLFFINYGFNVSTNVEIGKIAEILEKASIQAKRLKELYK